MKDIKDLDGLEIFLGYKCNVKCIFCYQKDLRYKYKDNIKKEEVIKLLQNGYLARKRFVIFSGGEPTLDNNLDYYISYSKKLGYKHIRVHTNGFRFKNYKYLMNLYNKGLTGITISIHGYKEVHDNITKLKGSFDIIVKALVNFEKLKKIDNNFVFDTNTVICKQNYKNIPKLIYFLSKFKITRGQIVLAYSLKYFSKKEKKELLINYNDLSFILEKSLDIAYLFNKKFVLENIPFCVIKNKYWKNIEKNIKIKKDSITIEEGNFGNTNLYWMLKKEICNKCIKKDKCRGVPEDYCEVYGIKGIKPILG